MKARNRIKPLLTLCCALLLVAAGVFGTLAYLTGTDTVNNTFTVGNVKITLDEAKVTTDGTPVEGADRVKANEYHLLPGHTYTKDPTVTVKTDEQMADELVDVMLTVDTAFVEQFSNALVFCRMQITEAVIFQLPLQLADT